MSEGEAIVGAPIKRKPRRLSEVFRRLAADADGPVSVAHICNVLGNRSFAALIVMFAVLNMIPLPPPASAILGLPLVIVSAQMVYGSRQAWLPDFIMRRSLSVEQFRTVMEWTLPRLVKLERLIRPRGWPFWRRRGNRWIGLIVLIMAIIVTLPIPFANWLPAFSSALLGLALSERDGILFAVGGAVGIAAVALAAFIVGAAGFATNALFSLF